MAITNSEREDHIKETAKQVFFKEGRFGATTQEIADAAGVNRTLVHYYFRSRDQLFEKVLREGHMEFRQTLSTLINEEKDFKSKISRFIDVWLEHSARYPYLDAYLVANINSPDNLVGVPGQTKEDARSSKLLFKQVELEMTKGTIVKMPPLQFFMNLLSLIAYPLTMRPLLEKSFQLSRKEYDKLMASRKENILAVLFRK